MSNIQSPKLIDYIYLITLSAIWGSAFVAIEYSLKDFSPFVIAFGRISLSALFLTIFVYINRLSFPKDIKIWSILLLLGALNNAIPFFLIPWGQQYISASTASVMLAIGPFIALVLSHFITKDENFTVFKFIGVIFGFIGVFILFGEDFFAGSQNSLYGKIALLFAVCGYILSGFLIRSISSVPTLVTSSGMFITATIFLIPFIFILPNNSNGEILSLSFLSIVYLAIIPTATASLLRIKLVQKIGVQFMSQVAYLIPIFAIFWSWIIFNQTPEYILIVALLFIFSGLFIRNIK